MRTDRPTLLFLVQTDWFFRSHRLPLALAAMDEGYRVVLACKTTRFASELSRLGIKVYPLTYIGGQKLNPLHEAISLLEILALYMKVRPEIVHHVSLRPVLLGSLAARLLRIPAIVNAVTGLGYLFHGKGGIVSVVRAIVLRALRYGFNHPQCRIIFQNRDDEQELKAAGLVGADQTVLIPGSGVDLANYMIVNKHNDPPVVLFGARMIYEKGAGELAEAGRLLNQRGTSCRILLCGEPDEGNPGAIPRATLQQWHDEGIVEWLGHRDDIPTLMAQADIACLPSYYREGIPKFLIESTASGLPIVTTDMPGCRETVLEGGNGILVQPEDAVSLADALQQLIENPNLRIEMGKASRQLAESRFSLELVVEKHMDVYRELTAD